jgi:hypothetical protein
MIFPCLVAGVCMGALIDVGFIRNDNLAKANTGKPEWNAGFSNNELNDKMCTLRLRRAPKLQHWEKKNPK